MSLRWTVAAALVGSTLMGCTGLLDLGAFQQGEDPGTGGNAGSGGVFIPPTCADDDGLCLDPLPTFWKGPAALVAADSPQQACSGAFPTLVTTGATELVGEDATCGCTCGTPTGQTCPSPTFHQYANNNCTPANNGGTLPQGCTGAFSPPPSGLSVSIDQDTPQGGTCAANLMEDIPTASSVQRTLCDSVPLEPCDEGLCAAPPGDGFEGRICIYTEGDIECPTSDGYAEKVVIYENVSDTRGCSDCTCGAPSGGACTGQSGAYSLNNCTQQKASIPHDGSCVALPSAGYGSIMMDIPQVSPGSCAPSTTMPTGTFEGTGEITTVCCTPSL